MRRRYTLFDWIFVIGMLLVCISMFLAIAVKKHPDWGDISIFSGVWLIISFIIMTGMIGASSGIPKNEVRVAKVPALIVFILAGLLFITGALLGGQI